MNNNIDQVALTFSLYTILIVMLIKRLQEPIKY